MSTRALGGRVSTCTNRRTPPVRGDEDAEPYCLRQDHCCAPTERPGRPAATVRDETPETR